jgi:hypothetical protein
MNLLVMRTTVRAVYRIPTGADGPGDAREVVDAEFGEVLPATVLEKVKLLVSEFVTNRIVGGDAGREDDELILDLCAGETVRCAVVDHGAAAVPSESALGVVDRLSSRWGLTRTSDVTKVWFETGASAA